MSAPDAVSLSHWIAQGVRHELLLRLLPSIRHDMLGPISVARMGVAVLVKRLGSEPPNLEGTLARAQELNQHLAQVTQQLREFRHWDPAQAGRVSLPAAVAQCSAWLQPAMALQGFELDLAPPAEQTAGSPLIDWPRDDMLFLAAGLICHVLDSWAPCVLHVAASATGVVLRAGERRPVPEVEHQRPLPPTRQIPLSALVALVDASQAVLTTGPGRVDLQMEEQVAVQA
ncbi:MAG TPA: hypothetical protein VLA61_28615 [Ideonella sp.]|uniref:hypothetical protein n=1 Tax=Ideonella sp. TaxID=1929293 RepID=UPI002CA942BC|nr:hypothetical protein [Ideonella sp.]HSI52248.1 hypothetical protein [Ideonella sp.]